MPTPPWNVYLIKPQEPYQTTWTKKQLCFTLSHRGQKASLLTRAQPRNYPFILYANHKQVLIKSSGQMK